MFELFFVSLEAFFGELFACVIAGVIAAMACRRHLVMVPACMLTSDRGRHIQQLIVKCIQRDVPCSAVLLERRAQDQDFEGYSRKYSCLLWLGYLLALWYRVFRQPDL